MRYQKIFLLLLIILGVMGFTPRSRAANFHNIEVEKNTYYPDEILNISASWENSDFVYGVSHYEIKIYDNLNNEVWISEDYEYGEDNIQLDIPLEDLSIDIIQYTGNLKVSLIYFPYSHPSGYNRGEDFFFLEKRDLNHTLHGFVNELKEKEDLDISIKLFDRLNGTRIENYTIGIQFNEIYWEENVTKSIEIHIGKEEIEYGTNMIRITFKRTLLYDEYEIMLKITLEELKEETLDQERNIIFLIIIIGVVLTIFGGIVYNGQQSRIINPMEINFRE